METCARYFTKAAFFIRHLEDGECKEITAREFNSYVLAKHVRKQIDGNFDYIKDKFNENKALALSANLDVSTYGTSEDDTVSEYSTEGGVELIDQDYPDQAGGLQPLLREFDLIDINYQPTSPSSSTADGWPGLTRAPSVSGSEMSASAFASYITTNKMSSSATSVCSSRRESRRPTERWPSLSSAASTQSVVSDCDDDDAASDTTTTPVPSNRHTAWRSSNTSDILFPGVRPRPVTEEEQLAALEPTKNMNTTRWWDPDHEDFDPEGFFSESNLSDHVSYCCIFPECDDAAGYEDLDSLKAHLKHAHLRVVHICPAASCYKRFAKASSLLAHTESNSKCKVQGADFYKRLVGDISGGLLDAKSMPVPKIWKPEQSMILAGGDTQLNGLMPTKFEVSRPETIW